MKWTVRNLVPSLDWSTRTTRWEVMLLLSATGIRLISLVIISSFLSISDAPSVQAPGDLRDRHTLLWRDIHGRTSQPNPALSVPPAGQHWRGNGDWTAVLWKVFVSREQSQSGIQCDEFWDNLDHLIKFKIVFFQGNRATDKGHTRKKRLFFFSTILHYDKC